MKVPSNYKIALSVLNRVVKKLKTQGIYDDYVNVFLQQERDNIIERFEVEP